MRSCPVVTGDERSLNGFFGRASRAATVSRVLDEQHGNSVGARLCELVKPVVDELAVAVRVEDERSRLLRGGFGQQQKCFRAAAGKLEPCVLGVDADDGIFSWSGRAGEQDAAFEQAAAGEGECGNREGE